MISQSSLRYFAGAVVPRGAISGPDSASAYVCHSPADRKLAIGLQAYLLYHGWKVGLLWEAETRPDAPAGVIAQSKKRLIESADWFIYLATEDSELDHWCQWELTVAKSMKPHERILVIPTVEGSSRFGDQYRREYRHLIRDANGVPVLLDPKNRRPVRVDYLARSE